MKIIFLGLLLILLTITPTTALAAIRGVVVVYEGGGMSNTIEAGWTGNHLLGQTFVPTVNKITGIRLTNFRLGKEGQNNGGIVQVALYEGTPTVSQVEVSPGVTTTRISPNPANLRAQVDRVYVSGWKLNHYLADLCAVGRNSSEDYALTELQINDPVRPCPQAWGTGGSTFLGSFDGTNRLNTVFPFGTAYSQATGWQSETTLEIPFPNNVVIPGRTYYVAIQQYYLSGSDYINEGKFNCLSPVSLNTPGGTEVCNKERVFIAPLTQDNRYSSGEAYFNDYYYSPGRDAATLSIWGIPAPTASISGPNTGSTTDTLTYTVNAQGTYISKVEAYYSPTSSNGPWTPLTLNTFRRFMGGWAGSATFTWSKPPAGSYYVAVNAFDDVNNLRCSGNPWGVTSGGYWSAGCGPGSYTQTTISSPLVAPACVSPIPNTTVNPGNVIFSWGPVTGASVYDFRLDDLSPWKEIVVTNGLTGTSAGPYNLSYGKSYRYRVSARNSSQIGPWTECNFSTTTLPTLGSMSIGPGPDAINDGPVTMSGLRSDDPALPGRGQNYKNSIAITQNFSNVNASNTRLAGIAFTNYTPAGSDLFSVTTSAYGGGFVLLYAPTSSTGYYFNGNGWYVSKNFTGGCYYAYYGGSWQDCLSSTLPTYIGTNIAFRPVPWNGSQLQFYVWPYQPLGSRTWKTYGYLLDTAGTPSTNYSP